MLLKRLGLIYLFIFFTSSSILYLFLDEKELLSYMVALFTSATVVLATFKSYRDIVNKRVALNDGVGEIDNRDYLDKLEDPYNLYEENSKDANNRDLKEIVKEERERLKESKRPLKEVAKDGARGFTYSRIFAYALLVGGFFFLLNMDALKLYFYLPALFIPNLVAVIYLMAIK